MNLSVNLFCKLMGVTIDTHSEIRVISSKENSQKSSQNVQNFKALRCRKCRGFVATRCQLAVDEYSTHRYTLNSSCGSYFLDPDAQTVDLDSKTKLLNLCSRYDKDSDAPIEGKIQCPKCSSKLGHYSWHGQKCSCGSWQVPAFMLNKDKVDIC